MPEQITRRETLKRGLVAASLLALVPEWTLPALVVRKYYIGAGQQASGRCRMSQP